jgi:hypothetical protein
MTAVRPVAPAAVPASRPTAALVRRPGWPLTALLVFFPLWWVLGLSGLIVFILAVPMALHLLRRRPIAVPPVFWLWLAFLFVVVASTALLGYNPPGTLPQAASTRLFAVGFNLAGYLAATIVLLYAGNLTEEEFPRRRLVRQLGFFFCVVVAGGLLGVIAPRFHFTSPVELLLPSSIGNDSFVKSLVHPAASQLQGVLGFEAPRPAAPFGFTNMWGNCLALGLGWFVISWIRGASGRRRLAGLAILVAATVPIVFSLNRGLWIALGLAVAFMVLRMATRGNFAALLGVGAVVLVAASLLVASPLANVIQARLDNPHSNTIRTFTTVQTLEVVEYSPVLGFGSTRAALGSGHSIAVGRNSDCPRCGNPPLGTNGQIWAVLIGQGYLGVVLYVGFFLGSLWVYRRDHTPIGDAGLLAIVFSLWFLLVYNSLTMPLVLSFLSIAMLWRNRRDTGAGVPEAFPSLAARPALATGAGPVASARRDE